MPSGHISRRQWAGPVAAVAAASFCAVLPWWHYGIPSGHDFEFHFNSWVEVVNHWKQGVIYPHWAAWAHYGYGEARFVFYPPASWTIGGGLCAILPWKLVPAAFVWIALTLAGLSMFFVARRWMSPGSALFAAIFYALNPYHLLIVYWRSAFAELLAAAYFPLLLLCVLRFEENGKRMIAPIALLLAAGWLTNIPSAVMMHYLLGVLVLWKVLREKQWKLVIYSGMAISAGAAIAAVYLVPVLHQRSWVSLDQVLSPGVRPQDNFLFSHTADADHDKFNLLVSIIAISEFALLAVVLLLWRAKRLAQLWWPLLVLSISCVLLMLPFTSPLWNHLPELRYVQFPWRWLLVLNLAVTLSVMIALRGWWLRAVACALALLPLLPGAQQILAPWWDHTGDLWEMVDNQHDRIGNEGADEYAPAGVDPYDIDQKAPLAKYEGLGTAKIAVSQWDSEQRVVTADATSPGKLVLRLFSYPSWQVSINGHLDNGETGSHGELLIPLRQGENRVEVSFGGGWDRAMGAAVSLLTLVLVLIYYARQRMRDRVFAETREPIAESGTS